MCVSNDTRDVLVAHALGSCLGITLYDPVAGVAGLLHVMLPLSSIDPSKARACPFMFVDTGVPIFFRAAYARGADKRRLVVKVAGGASIAQLTNGSEVIGRRNFVVLKKLLWQNGILVTADEVGGRTARTMSIEVRTGVVTISNAGVSRYL
jgi:chemotaxis protein CheD